MSAAKMLNNELFQENWTKLNTVKKEQEGIISYLIVEEINPPDYVWDKIATELDKHLKSNKMQNSIEVSKKATIALLIGGAIISVSAILYFLL